MEQIPIVRPNALADRFLTSPGNAARRTPAAPPGAGRSARPRLMYRLRAVRRYRVNVTHAVFGWASVSVHVLPVVPLHAPPHTGVPLTGFA